jgi:hypothetical protein
VGYLGDMIHGRGQRKFRRRDDKKREGAADAVLDPSEKTNNDIIKLLITKMGQK